MTANTTAVVETWRCKCGHVYHSPVKLRGVYHGRCPQRRPSAEPPAMRRV